MPQQITYEARHLLPDKDAKCIFNHIPKCGGSTLRKMLIKSIEAHKQLEKMNLLNIPVKDCKTINLFQATKLFFGHDVASLQYLIPEEQSFFYITFLRHPFARICSHLFYLKHTQPYAYSNLSIISQFYTLTQSNKNYLINFLGNGDKCLAEENLFQNYAFFGLVEYYNDSIRALSDYIPALVNIPLIAQNIMSKNNTQKQEISELAKEYFYEVNRDDIELFEKAKKEFLRRVKPTEQTRTSVPSEEIQPYSLRQSDFGIRRSDNILKQFFSSLKFDINILNMSSLQWNLFFLAQSLHNAKDIEQAIIYCMDIVKQSPASLFYAFQFAKKINSPQLYNIAKQLFSLCQKVDPENNMRVVVECRADIIRTIMNKKLWQNDAIFEQSLQKWAEELYFVRSWEVLSLTLQAQILLHTTTHTTILADTNFPVHTENFDKINKLLCEALTRKPDELHLHALYFNAQAQKNKTNIDWTWLEHLEKEAQTALEEKETTEWALRQLALCFEQKEDFEEAFHFAQKALHKNPVWDAGWRISLNYLLQNQEHVPQNIVNGVAKQAVEFASEQLIENLIQNKNWNAHRTFEKNILQYFETQQLPIKLLRLTLQAKIEIYKNEPDEALALLQQAFPLQADDLELHELYFNALELKHSDTLDWLNELEKDARKELLKTPDKEWALRQLALCLEKKGENDEAFIYAQKALSISPAWERGWIFALKHMIKKTEHCDLDFARLAIPYISSSKEISDLLYQLFYEQSTLTSSFTDLFSLLEKIVAVNPKQGYHYKSIAKILQSQGKHKKAQESLIEARKHALACIQKEPETIALRVDYVDTLLQLKDFATLEKEAKQGMCNFPDLGWPYMQIGMIYKEQGKLARAIEFMEKAIEKQPEKLSFSALYSSFLRQNKNFEQAEVLCQSLIQKNPDLSFAWRELYKCALAQNDKTKIHTYKNALLKHDPDNAQAFFDNAEEKEVGYLV